MPVSMCCGLIPVGSWAPHSRLFTPLSGMGERIRRVKVRRVVGWDKDGLIGKVKAVHAGKAKQGIHSLRPTGRQVFSHLQESRSLLCLVVTGEDERCHFPCPLLPCPSPSFYCWAWCHIAWDIPLVSCPSCVPSQLLVQHQPARWRDGGRNRKGLDAV